MSPYKRMTMDKWTDIDRRKRGVSSFLNFKVNLRKIISLEPHLKIETGVNKVFFYKTMYF